MNCTLPITISSTASNSYQEINANVGYGHTVPLSDGGKVFCIFYTLLGLPATLLLATCLLQRLMGLLTHRPVQYLHTHWGIPPGHAALGHAATMGLSVLGLFILLPALCFWALENGWNFLESVYFCFISLSTIGLGDYVPGRSSPASLRHLYKISITYDDRLEILSRDQLGLATVCGAPPSWSQADNEADGRAAPPDGPSG
ncbi:Potassium channel subfamily K member 1 [Chelonia mydas]|uniref:Potassium channel subfamily K member 1 n=1 Tax=Chelonia mydas TaxID=8469 RepID=M7ASH2_CHEMY|nr:Potassium channel subfamily K member 1 [Chelonia mydas]